MPVIDTTTLPHLQDRHPAPVTIRFLSLIHDQADPAILRNWAADLKQNAHLQTHGTYCRVVGDQPPCYCAMGRLIALKHPELSPYGVADFTAVNNQLATLLGISEDVNSDTIFWGVARMNDDLKSSPNNLGLTFPQIADILEAVADAQV